MPIDEQGSNRISVIIPTYNAGPSLEELLTRLQGQTLPPLEIIVVDSSSSDGTAELAQRGGARVFTILQSEFDHGGTRNYAAAQAKGDILVFMTQDAMPQEGQLLEALARPLADKKVACVYGRQLARPDAAVLERLARSFNYPEQSMMKDQSDLPRMGIKTFFCSNVCSAIRKDMFMEMGRFPEPVIFNEDLFMAAKCVLAGYGIYYSAEAKVIHSHDYSLQQQFRRFFDNGVSMRNNDWIYAYSKVGNEGKRMLLNQLKALHHERKWHWIPVMIAESFAKIAGYQLGKHHRKLPNALCVRFSMHRKIWDKLQQTGKGLPM
ncbi:glycosyltransferase family 2 protein [Paenibacillus abyssi]|uniref:Rhamnosyltransferase n=1 Tax=Paenibacillus abyssi TaxID=1340531 RepID=A0A917CL69_9BACL|nr:glycosyltransferase family 2 protein [Paenibacillus abyssi]GGF92201.1 rhamnosyltransferase [Paenibacillus abyssi]